MPAIAARGLEKSFGPVGVLRGLDMIVSAGEVFTIFGPNGAGKTTLIRVLATLTRLDGGEMTINGFDPSKHRERLRTTVGVVLHESLLYGDLTGRENLRFYSKMFRIADPEGRIDTVAARMNVAHRLDEKVRNLSHGLRKRVTFARALLHRPKLLLLDEPESGLDQRTLRLFEELLADYRAAGGAVVMTTHSLDEGLAVADRIAILARGRFTFTAERKNVTHDEMSGIYDRFSGDE